MAAILSVSKALYCQISSTIEKIEFGPFTMVDGQLIPNMSRLKSTEHDNFRGDFFSRSVDGCYMLLSLKL